ncbi:hypothetical protein R6Q59_013697 [Mikania micrantha]
MITSPSPHYAFQDPTQKHEDEEPLVIDVGPGQSLDQGRWQSRRKFLKSYRFSSGRPRVKEKMKKYARKIGFRVYRVTITWPGVCVLRCYVPLPNMEVKVASE